MCGLALNFTHATRNGYNTREWWNIRGVKKGVIGFNGCICFGMMQSQKLKLVFSKQREPHICIIHFNIFHRFCFKCYNRNNKLSRPILINCFRKNSSRWVSKYSDSKVQQRTRMPMLKSQSRHGIFCAFYIDVTNLF